MSVTFPQEYVPDSPNIVNPEQILEARKSAPKSTVKLVKPVSEPGINVAVVSVEVVASFLLVVLPIIPVRPGVATAIELGEFT
jgi:hypothetical protein